MTTVYQKPPGRIRHLGDKRLLARWLVFRAGASIFDLDAIPAIIIVRASRGAASTSLFNLVLRHYLSPVSHAVS